MNKYIRHNVALPTTDIFDENLLTRFIWEGFTDSTTSQDIVAAGFVLLPEPSTIKTDGDILVADKDQSGVVVALWVSQSEYASIVESRRLSSIARLRRNKLLSACDWTQGKDVPESVSAICAPYRQALRDVTLQDEFPRSIVWPTPPTA